MGFKNNEPVGYYRQQSSGKTWMEARLLIWRYVLIWREVVKIIKNAYKGIREIEW